VQAEVSHCTELPNFNENSTFRKPTATRTAKKSPASYGIRRRSRSHVRSVNTTHTINTHLHNESTQTVGSKVLCAGTSVCGLAQVIDVKDTCWPGHSSGGWSLSPTAEIRVRPQGNPRGTDNGHNSVGAGSLRINEHFASVPYTLI
jgi:hypothetical protein